MYNKAVFFPTSPPILKLSVQSVYMSIVDFTVHIPTLRLGTLLCSLGCLTKPLTLVEMQETARGISL